MNVNFKKIISTIILTTFSLSNVALAQNTTEADQAAATKSVKDALPPVELQPGERDPGMAISPMKRGQRAPFTGILLSPSAAADVIVEFETFEEKLHIEVMRAMAEEQAACDKKLKDAEARSTADKEVLQANLDSKKKEVEAYRVELKNINDSQPNPYLWAGLGIAGGIAITLLSVFAVTQVTK